MSRLRWLEDVEKDLRMLKETETMNRTERASDVKEIKTHRALVPINK